MNVVYFFLFLFFAPYLQIFTGNRFFLFLGLNFTPSVIISAVVLFAVKMPLPVAYTFAFFAGVASSLLYGLPGGLNSISYILIVFLVRKFGERFDMAGFVGQFIFGFAAVLFSWFCLLVPCVFLKLNHPSFWGAFLQAVSTGILLIILFGNFFTKRKSVL
ncbi:MAG: hypothetical protein ABIJ15_01220 [bacterium]